MLSKEKREDLIIQLVLLLVSLGICALAMVPAWKWELWLSQLRKTADAAKHAAPGLLSPEQEQMVRDFRDSVARWSHEGTS
jgi:hypothetical protein